VVHFQYSAYTDVDAPSADGRAGTLELASASARKFVSPLACHAFSLQLCIVEHLVRCVCARCVQSNGDWAMAATEQKLIALLPLTSSQPAD